MEHSSITQKKSQRCCCSLHYQHCYPIRILRLPQSNLFSVADWVVHPLFAQTRAKCCRALAPLRQSPAVSLVTFASIVASKLPMVLAQELERWSTQLFGRMQSQCLGIHQVAALVLDEWTPAESWMGPISKRLHRRIHICLGPRLGSFLSLSNPNFLSAWVGLLIQFSLWLLVA